MPAKRENIVIEGQICEGQTLGEQSGHDVRVTVLRGGKSINGYSYDQSALQQVSRLLEGAQAYADHGRTPEDLRSRSMRDLVGFYKDPQYMPPDALVPEGRVDATLHVMDAAPWLWSLIREAVQLGKPDLVGLSVDILGSWQPGDDAKAVTKVHRLLSCDVVTRPSAGGRIQRILHSDSSETSEDSDDSPVSTPQGDPTPMADPTTPSPVASQVNITEVQNLTQLREEQQLALAQLKSEQESARAAREEHARIINEAKIERAGILLERRLMESQLPEEVLASVRNRFVGRIFEESELASELEATRLMLAGLANKGLIRGSGWEKPAVGSMITEAEKLQAALHLMFEDSTVRMLEDAERTRFGGIKPFASIREAYARITGDPGVTGASSFDLGAIRVTENAPIGRITEADTTTASFSFLLGTSMNKRLLKDYQAWPAEWQKFCTITPIKDFKQQTRVRLGAFGSLSTVPEDTAYTTITLQDSAATYVPTKRGNLVTVSRETIINDDLFAIKQIPTKLAVAAAYTLAEFVYGFLSGNGTIYDGSALFLVGAPHTNLGTSALSSASMQLGVTAMREQQNFAGKRLGLRPSYLIVPAELEWVAMVATKSAGVPGSTNNDINPMLGYVTPIVAPQLSNASQWFFAADPRIIDTIEIGFVGGQVNPALFIQDQPLFGLNFTQDVISYKIRHEYGGAVVDFRGLYRGI